MIKRKPPVSFPHISFIRRLSFSVQPFIVTKSLPHNLEALNGKSLCQKVYRGFENRSGGEWRIYTETLVVRAQPDGPRNRRHHRRGNLRLDRNRRRVTCRPRRNA